MAKQSLVSLEVPKQLGLPAIFDEPAPDIVESGASTAYCTFISPKSKLWASLATQIPGLQEPDVVLIRPKPEAPVRLAPFQFCVCTAKQYWCVSDQDGAVTEAWLLKPPYDPVIKEVIEAVLLVFTPDGVVPARCSFKSTKCGAVKAAIAALRLAAEPEWAKQSAAHADTMKLPRPFLRFYTTVSCQQRVSRTSGFKYFQADGAVSPTTPNEWAPLSKLLQDEARLSQLTAAKEAHDRRLEEIAAVAAKTK